MHSESIADGIDLWHGNSFECLPLIGKVDHVICDPPYEVHMHERGGKVLRTDGGPELEKIPFASIEDIRHSAAQVMVKASAGWLLVFCTAEGVALWRDEIEAAGAKYKRACAWIKPDSAPQFNGQGPAHGFENVIAAWCGKGHSSWNGGGRRGVFTHNVNPPDRDGRHPTEKPVSLMLELVELFTKPGDVILDPFMGSGSTGIACVRSGRKFIGIELDLKFYQVAKERMLDELRRPSFFVSYPKLKQGTLEL